MSFGITDLEQPQKKTVLMVAMFPPPFSSGERLANLTIKEILKTEYIVDSINVSTGKLNPSRFGIKKILNQAQSIWLYIKAISAAKKIVKAKQVYALYFVTPASSFGHIRDWILLSAIGNKVPYKFAFIHNGHIHEILNRKSHKFLTASFIKKVSCFVFLTKGLEERSHIIPANKRTVIGNSIDPLVTFTANEIFQKIETPRKQLNLLFLSNMNPAKGYMDVAKAIKIFKIKNKNCTISADFVGEWLSEEQEHAFRKFVQTTGLQDIIKIHGKLNDRSVIKSFLYNASIFLLPTYYSHEAQPLSIIEALNAGNVVIATKHASIPEYIINGYNGFLVDKQDPEAIAGCLEKLIDNSLWKKMAQNARNSFEKDFSYKVYGQRIITLFEQTNRYDI